MIVATLPLPPGYRADWVLSYLGRDPASPAERVAGGTLRKVLDLGADGTVAVDVHMVDGRADIEVDRDLSPATMERVRYTVGRALGLTQDGSGLEARAATDPLFARLVGDRAGLRIPQSATVFEGLCWAIVGQQVNLTFAGTLRRTLIELAGRVHAPGWIAHPTADRVAALDPADLTARKFSRSKADYLIGVAQVIAGGGLDIEGLPDLPAEEAERRLTGIRGIGPWTRQYVLLRACGFPDCVPVGDAGLAAALQRFHGMDRRPTPAEQGEMMRPFAPWRSLATAHLWASLS